MSAFVASTVAALDGCQTQSDYYRVQFDILMLATPKDFGALLAELPAHNWVEPFKMWLTRQYQNMTAHHPVLSQYVLSAGNEAASLYSEGPGRANLVVGFCGRAQLLFLPAATIMQYISPGADLMILRDFSKMGFTAGIDGYGDTFTAMLDALRRTFDFGRYTNIRCIGTSGSGAAALAAGVVLEADRAASFCGHLPSGRRRGDQLSHEIEDIITNSPGSPQRFYAVFGDKCERDNRNAHAIARAFGITLYPILNIDAHNVVVHLHRHGGLARVLKDIGLTD